MKRLKSSFKKRFRTRSNMFGLLHLEDEVKICDLFEKLKGKNNLVCEYKYFRSMFIPTLIILVKVKWYGTLGELVIIFDTLAAEEIIPATFYIAKLIRLNFIDKKGQPIKNRSLWTIRNTVSDEKAFEIQEMINDLGRKKKEK
jgi:hypothetical protein